MNNNHWGSDGGCVDEGGDGGTSGGGKSGNGDGGGDRGHCGKMNTRLGLEIIRCLPKSTSEKMLKRHFYYLLKTQQFFSSNFFPFADIKE